MLHCTVDDLSNTKGKPMNPMQSYMDAIKPFAEPYLAMVDAYAKILQSVGGSPPPSEEAKGPLKAWEDAAGYAAPTVDATEKAETPAEPKRTISHSAAAARGIKAWETRRANEAQAAEAKAKKARARKASRNKARNRAH
jgi:hypothetical protein